MIKTDEVSKVLILQGPKAHQVLDLVPVVCDDCGKTVCYIEKFEGERPNGQTITYTEDGHMHYYHEYISIYANVSKHMHDGSDKVFCNHCIDNYGQCEDCTLWFPREDLVDVEDGDRQVCEECKNNNYEYCPHCHNLCYEENFHQVWLNSRDYESWCESCTDDDAFYCDHCDEWYSDSVESHRPINSDATICDYCALDSDDFRWCDDCGRLMYESDAYWDEDSENYYCPNCYDRCAGGIHDYHHYQTDWVFTCSKNQEKVSSNLERRRKYLHVGREIEISRGGTNYSNALSILKSFGVTEEQFRLSRDGSLSNGFEMITDPMTLEAEPTVNWEAGLNQAADLGYRAHNSGDCGLHFHMDRIYFENGKCYSPESNMVVLITNNAKWLREFSRRQNFEYCNWVSCNKFQKSDFKGNEAVEKNALDEIQRLRNCYNGHYRALNFSNCGTIEMRFIRGTLKYSTMLAARQLVEMWAFVSKHATLEKICDIDLNWFMRYAKHKGYNAFLDYLKERNIA